MANKKSSKKKAQPQAEAKAVAKQAPKAADKKDATAKKVAKAKKADKDKKPGVFARIKKYFSDVRSEMKRVVWPTKQELVNYSVAVCASLVVVGVVIALLDAVIGEGLVLFSGLRG